MTHQGACADSPLADKAIALLEALRTGDRQAIVSLFHQDARWWVLGRGYKPVNELIDITCEMAKSSQSRPMTILGTTSEGSRVAIEAQGHVVLADGKHYDNTYHFLFLFADDRIIEGREYLDTELVSKTFEGRF